jgi:hypothetical protein
VPLVSASVRRPVAALLRNLIVARPSRSGERIPQSFEPSTLTAKCKAQALSAFIPFAFSNRISRRFLLTCVSQFPGLLAVPSLNGEAKESTKLNAEQESAARRRPRLG